MRSSPQDQKESFHSLGKIRRPVLHTDNTNIYSQRFQMRCNTVNSSRISTCLREIGRRDEKNFHFYLYSFNAFEGDDMKHNKELERVEQYQRHLHPSRGN